MSIRVIIDNATVIFPDQQPRLVSDRTFVPIRPVFEHMGFTVQWTAGTGVGPEGTATLTKSNYTITVKEHATTFTTNNIIYSHPDGMPALVIGGRTMVPIRGLLESIGCSVDWDDATETVIVATHSIHVTGVTIDNISKTTINMAVGEEKSVSCTVSPSNATDKSITWTSEPGASVVSTGTNTAKVTALAVGGPVAITARSNDNTNKSDYFNVNVEAPDSLDVTNLNQKYIENLPAIIDAGCAACCVADISSFYAREEITITQLIEDEKTITSTTDVSVVWPNLKHFSRTLIFPTKDASFDVYSFIKEQINKSHPVLLHYTSVYSAQYGHWVVAYKYIDSCTSDSDVYMCEPVYTRINNQVRYSGYYDENNPDGEDLRKYKYNNGITIQEAKDKQSITSLWEIYSTESK